MADLLKSNQNGSTKCKPNFVIFVTIAVSRKIFLNARSVAVRGTKLKQVTSGLIGGEKDFSKGKDRVVGGGVLGRERVVSRQEELEVHQAENST